MEISEAKVTIVIPAYNAEKYIGRALDSVLNQTFEYWNAIVVDDGSTDKTRSIISEYSQRDTRITYYSISNSGSAKYPRDLAIYHSNTDYVLFLDADDYLDNDYLQKAWDVKCKTNAEVVLSVMHVFSEESGDFLYDIPDNNFNNTKIYAGRELVKCILNKWEIGFNGGMFNKKYLQKTLSYPKKDSPIYMNSDEYDSRAILCQNPIVAFSEGHYNFWANSQSITQRVSIKRFDRIYTGIQLYELINKEFQPGSEEVSLINNQNWGVLREALSLMCANYRNFTREEICMLYNAGKDLFNTIDRKKIEGGIVTRLSYLGLCIWMYVKFAIGK